MDGNGSQQVWQLLNAPDKNQQAKQEPDQQAEKTYGLIGVFQNMLRANKFVNKDGFSQLEQRNLNNPHYKEPRIDESYMKQALSSLDKSVKVLNHLSARNMNYQQIMGCLGKRTFHQRKLARQA